MNKGGRLSAACAKLIDLKIDANWLRRTEKGRLL